MSYCTAVEWFAWQRQGQKIKVNAVMSPPATNPARKALLEAGDRLAAMPEDLGSLTVSSLAREAGVSEKTFFDSFEDLGRFWHALLVHVMDVIRTAVLTAASDLAEPGFERMWRCVEAYLDANRRHLPCAK